MKHYLDVSNTFLFWHGSPTGIQRVIQGLCRAAEGEGFRLAVFHPGSRCWREVPVPLMLETFQPDLFVKSNQRLKAFMKSSSGNGRSKASQWIRSSVGKVFKPVYHHGAHQLGMWMGKQARDALLQKKGSPIEFQAGDRLYVVDANWDVPGFLPALRERKKIQPALDVIGFVYDITPITHPQFITNEAFISQFSSWISELLEVSSWILADSRDAANEVARVYGRQSVGDGKFALQLPGGKTVEHRFPPRAVRFGSGIEIAADTSSPPSGREIIQKIEAARFSLSEDQRKALLEAQGWALWVGVLHPRKNLDVQINALDPLWKSAEIRLPLFWVGRPGGGVGDLLHRVSKTPHLKANVIRLESCPDSLLWELFRGARFSLYTSWTEGFGLPVSESLQHGCPVIASSGGSIPEVAGDLVDYFEPWDAKGLQELILKYLKDSDEYGKVRDRVDLPPIFQSSFNVSLAVS